MKHPWVRMPDLASALGLVLGAIGTIIIGSQIKNCWVILVGILSLLFFVLFLSVLLHLIIRDYIKLFPRLKRKILGIRY
jgi:multisubunit Na+/H+ antiporter MnhG subunit